MLSGLSLFFYAVQFVGRTFAMLARLVDILDMPLLDHLIVGDAGRYFSFREAGTLTAQIADGVRA